MCALLGNELQSLYGLSYSDFFSPISLHFRIADSWYQLSLTSFFSSFFWTFFYKSMPELILSRTENLYVSHVFQIIRKMVQSAYSRVDTSRKHLWWHSENLALSSARNLNLKQSIQALYHKQGLLGQLNKFYKRLFNGPTFISRHLSTISAMREANLSMQSYSFVITIPLSTVSVKHPSRWSVRLPFEKYVCVM